jgi:hypothetical protein
MPWLLSCHMGPALACFFPDKLRAGASSKMHGGGLLPVPIPNHAATSSTLPCRATGLLGSASALLHMFHQFKMYPRCGLQGCPQLASAHQRRVLRRGPLGAARPAAGAAGQGPAGRAKVLPAHAVRHVGALRHAGSGRNSEWEMHMPCLCRGALSHCHCVQMVVIRPGHYWRLGLGVVLSSQRDGYHASRRSPHVAMQWGGGLPDLAARVWRRGGAI